MFWRFKYLISKVYIKSMIWFTKRLPKEVRYWVLINEGAKYSTKIDPNICPSDIKYFDLVENVA